MTQASYWWKQLNKLWQSSSPYWRQSYRTKSEEKAFKSFSLNQFGSLSSWLILGIAVVTMLLWNWKLLLATGVGIGVMLAVYVLQELNWLFYWSKLRRFLRSANRQLTLAIISGGLGVLCTYTAAAIWADTANHWLATGAIFQGLGILLIIAILGWQLLSSQFEREENRYDQLLNNLTQPNPLKRLITVRKLGTLLVRSPRFLQQHGSEVVEYLSLMLTQEEEKVIQEAILESLQGWQEQGRQTKANSQPLQMPINLRTTQSKLSRRV